MGDDVGSGERRAESLELDAWLEPVVISNVIVTPPWPPGEAALDMEPCLLAYDQRSGLVG